VPGDRTHPLGHAFLDTAGFNGRVLVELLVAGSTLAEVRSDVHLVTDLHPVLPAEPDGVHPKVVGDVLHVGLEGEECLWGAIAPVGAGYGDVGVHDVTVERLVVTVVRGEAAQAADDLDRETVGTVGARVSHKRHVLGHERSVGGHTGPVRDGLGMPGAAGEELLRPGQLQLHGAVRGDGQVGGDVLDQHLLLGTEATSDTRLDYADVLDLHVDERCQHPAGVERNLRRGPDDHAFV
jgi:hypothetical protein